MPQPAQEGGELSTPPAVCPRRMRVLRHERVQAGLTQGAVRGSIGCPSVMVATPPAVQKKVRFVTNTGSGFTIIPPELHHPGTGTLIPSDISLMSWGSKDRLAVRGNFTTQLMTVRGGATITTSRGDSGGEGCFGFRFHQILWPRERAHGGGALLLHARAHRHCDL